MPRDTPTSQDALESLSSSPPSSESRMIVENFPHQNESTILKSSQSSDFEHQNRSPKLRSSKTLKKKRTKARRRSSCPGSVSSFVDAEDEDTISLLERTSNDASNQHQNWSSGTAYKDATSNVENGFEAFGDGLDTRSDKRVPQAARAWWQPFRTVGVDADDETIEMSDNEVRGYLQVQSEWTPEPKKMKNERKEKREERSPRQRRRSSWHSAMTTDQQNGNDEGVSFLRSHDDASKSSPGNEPSPSAVHPPDLTAIKTAKIGKKMGRRSSWHGSSFVASDMRGHVGFQDDGSVMAPLLPACKTRREYSLPPDETQSADGDVNEDEHTMLLDKPVRDRLPRRRSLSTDSSDQITAIERLMANPAFVGATKGTADVNGTAVRGGRSSTSEEQPPAFYESEASGYVSGASINSTTRSSRVRLRRIASSSDLIGAPARPAVVKKRTQEQVWMQAIQGMMQDPDFIQALKECSERGGNAAQQPPSAPSYESEAMSSLLVPPPSARKTRLEYSRSLGGARSADRGAKENGKTVLLDKTTKGRLPKRRCRSATDNPDWNVTIERMMANPAFVGAMKGQAKVVEKAVRGSCGSISDEQPATFYESEASGYVSGASAATAPKSSRGRAKRRASWSDSSATPALPAPVRKLTQEQIWMQAIQGMMQDPAFVEALKESSEEDRETQEDMHAGTGAGQLSATTAHEAGASVYLNGATKSPPWVKPSGSEPKGDSSWSRALDDMEPNIRQLSGSQEPPWAQTIKGKMNDPFFVESLEECAQEEEAAVATLGSMENAMSVPKGGHVAVSPIKAASRSGTNGEIAKDHSVLSDEEDSLPDEWGKFVHRYVSNGASKQQGSKHNRHSSWNGTSGFSGLSSLLGRDTSVSMPSPVSTATTTAGCGISQEPSHAPRGKQGKLDYPPTFYVDLDDPESAPPRGSLPMARQRRRSASVTRDAGCSSSEDDPPLKETRSRTLFRGLSTISRTGENVKTRNGRFRSRLGVSRSASPVRGHLVVSSASMPARGVHCGGVNPALLNSADTTNGIHCVQLTALGDVATCNFGYVAD